TTAWTGSLTSPAAAREEESPATKATVTAFLGILVPQAVTDSTNLAIARSSMLKDQAFGL
ncbi:MAG: hypothetical protein ACK53L_15395, partial [Pirellulaceae bacterium]